MSDKGGKGYTPLSKGGLKGKDDSATKSAKGRKVQFSKEGPLGSRINSPLYGNGDFSKGGKADKAANGGKGAASKNSQQPELKVDQELPKNIKCLMDCEAANILQGIQSNMVSLSRDPAIKIPVSFDKGLLYAKSGHKYTNPESVRRILEPLLEHGLTESEICVIANVGPVTGPLTPDVVFALLPSLKGRRNINNQLLEDSLSDLAKLSQPL